MVARGDGSGGGGGTVREFGIDMYTLLYFKWLTNKVLLYSTGNSAQHHVAAWMGGKFGGRMDTCYVCVCVCVCVHIRVYVWLSPFAVHLKLS